MPVTEAFGRVIGIMRFNYATPSATAGRYVANIYTFTVRRGACTVLLRPFTGPAGVLEDVILWWEDSGNLALSSTILRLYSAFCPNTLLKLYGYNTPFKTSSCPRRPGFNILNCAAFRVKGERDSIFLHPINPPGSFSSLPPKLFVVGRARMRSLAGNSVPFNSRFGMRLGDSGVESGVRPIFPWAFG